MSFYRYPKRPHFQRFGKERGTSRTSAKSAVTSCPHSNGRTGSRKQERLRCDQKCFEAKARPEWDFR